eukprot:scaffold673401_cov48-Prasinocladus_malaysianus.AAC.1
MKFFEYLRKGDDPTTVAIVMEDGGAVAGLLIAGEGWRAPCNVSPPSQALDGLYLVYIYFHIHPDEAQ